MFSFHYSCYKCNIFYWDLQKLQEHIASHAQNIQKDWSRLCDLCGRTFHNNSTFQMHANSHAPPGIRRTFECYLCKKVVNTKVALSYHMGNHCPRPKLICHVCSSEFARKSSLDRHIITHIDIYPFTCPHCDKKFKFKKSLDVSETKFYSL